MVCIELENNKNPWHRNTYIQANEATSQPFQGAAMQCVFLPDTSRTGSRYCRVMRQSILLLVMGPPGSCCPSALLSYAGAGSTCRMRPAPGRAQEHTLRGPALLPTFAGARVRWASLHKESLKTYMSRHPVPFG